MWNQYSTVKLLPPRRFLLGPTYSWLGVRCSNTSALNTCIWHYSTSFLNNMGETPTFSPRQWFMIPSLLLQLLGSDMKPKRSREGRARGRKVVNSCWVVFSSSPDWKVISLHKLEAQLCWEGCVQKEKPMSESLNHSAIFQQLLHLIVSRINQKKNISTPAFLCTNISKISANCQHVWLIQEKQKNF